MVRALSQPVDLVPLLDDLRALLGLSDADFQAILTAPAGQPFRLFLLEILLTISRDPDVAFC